MAAEDERDHERHWLHEHHRHQHRHGGHQMGAPVTMSANQKVTGVAKASAAGVPVASGLSYAFSDDSGGAVAVTSSDDSVTVTGDPAASSTVTVTVNVVVTNPDGSTVSDSSVITVNPAVAPPAPANADAVTLDFGTPEDQ